MADSWGATNPKYNGVDTPETYPQCPYRSWVASQMRWTCDSPIEVLLGGAITTLMTAPSVRYYSFYDSQPEVLPQYRFGRFRADLVVGLWKKPPTDHAPLDFIFCAVECDGHKFHEATKEQAAKDKKRDRWFASNGIPLLRFTGSEIYRDPFMCAHEVVQLCANQDDQLVRFLRTST